MYLKINETILKFILAFLQISPNPQGFLSFVVVKLTAQSDDVAYIVHFQLSTMKRRINFYCKMGNNLKYLFVMKCTLFLHSDSDGSVAYSLSGSQSDHV